MDDEISEKLLCLKTEFGNENSKAKKSKNKSIMASLLSNQSIKIASSALLALNIKYPRFVRNINFDTFLLSPDTSVNELANKILFKKDTLTIYERMMYLNDISIFQDIKFEELELLAQSSKLKEYAPKVYIIEQGGVVDTLFIIMSGKANVHKDSKKIKTLTDKDYFGEIAILGDTKRTVSVKTVTKLKALTISKRDFQKFLDENPKTHNKLMKNIIQKLLDIQDKQH